MKSETIQKSRLRFFFQRLLVSAIMFLSLALLVRLSWYPGAHFHIDGAVERLLVLAGVIVVLGPGLSTLVYRPGKSKLLTDMSILMALEVATLGIAARLIYADRPAFLVFAIDRFEVIRADELDRQQLRYDELYSPSGDAPHLAIARLPEDPTELSELVLSVVLEGAADIDRRPDYWHPYVSGHDEVLDRGRPISLLEAHDLDGNLADWYADSQLRKEDLLFLPICGSVRDGALIVSRSDARPLAIVDIHPWLD